MGHFVEGWTLGNAPLSSTWGRTSQKSFPSSSWRPGPGWMPLSQGAEGRIKGLVFVTNAHILLSSKPFDSDFMAVRFPGSPVVKNMPANTGDSGDASSVPGSGRRKWQPIPVFLPGQFHGQRSLGGYSPWGCKEHAQLLPTCGRHLLSLNSLTNGLSSSLTFPQLFYVH